MKPAPPLNPFWPQLADETLRSPGELQRAARRHLRSRQRAEPPWRVPVLFVPGLGGSRLALLEPQTWSSEGTHDRSLWDPDDASAQACLYAGLHRGGAESRAWPAELARRWLAGAQVLRGHERAERLRLMSREHGFTQEPAPALEALLLARYEHLHACGWTALPQAYWPLAELLADTRGADGDPQFVHEAHAHAWDWRAHPASAAPGLARHIRALLTQADATASERPWRRAAGLVIVAENSGLDLVQAALPLCEPGAVLAVYAVDDVRPAARSGIDAAADGCAAWLAELLCNADAAQAGLSRTLLSMGWRAWREALRDARGARLAVNAVLPGSMSLLPRADARRWLDSKMPRARLDDPLALLRAGLAWHAPSQQFVQFAGAEPWAEVPGSEEQEWQASTRRAAVRGPDPPVLPGGLAWVSCLSATGTGLPVASGVELRFDPWPAQGEASPDLLRWHCALAAGEDELQDEDAHAPVALRCNSLAQLCNAIRRYIGQQLLRQAATPWGQELSPALLARLSNVSEADSA